MSIGLALLVTILAAVFIGINILISQIFSDPWISLFLRAVVLLQWVILLCFIIKLN